MRIFKPLELQIQNTKNQSTERFAVLNGKLDIESLEKISKKRK